MAMIAQPRLFGWEEIEELGDLQRLQLVVQYMPDEKLMLVLEEERDRGRDEYRIKPVIGIRNLWKAGEETKGVGRREMAFGGFENGEVGSLSLPRCQIWENRAYILKKWCDGMR